MGGTGTPKKLAAAFNLPTLHFCNLCIRVFTGRSDTYKKVTMRETIYGIKSSASKKGEDRGKLDKWINFFKKQIDFTPLNIVHRPSRAKPDLVRIRQRVQVANGDIRRLALDEVARNLQKRKKFRSVISIPNT